MSDLGELIAHWGYGAIFLAVVLRNVGLPVPEETILALAGYLAWQRRLRLPAGLAVGFVSAVAAAEASRPPTSQSAVGGGGVFE